MSDPVPHTASQQSVVVSDEPQPSLNSRLSDPKRRMRKILSLLKSRAEQERDKDGDGASVDYDALVDDGDLRYLLAADVTADLIRTQRANEIKSGFEDYVGAVRILDSVTPILLLLMGLFILFGRPEWCAGLGTYINYACTHSLDPARPVEYLVTRAPMLSASTKTFICMACMAAITLTNLLKVGVTVSSATHRNSLYFCLCLLGSYFALFFLETFAGVNVLFSDIFPVLFAIFNLPSLQKIVGKTLDIMVLSKEIIIFYTLILAMVAISARALFSGVPAFFDADGASYFLYNFADFGSAVYTAVVTFFFMDGVYSMGLALLAGHRLYVAYWVLVGLFVKFFLLNLVCGVLAYYYNTLFESETRFMEGFPDLKQRVKEEIVLETAEYSRLKAMVKKYHRAGFYDRDIVDIEEFYRVTTVNRGVTWNADNPHSVANAYAELAASDAFVIGIGLVELLGVVLILFSLSADASALAYIYIALFIVNFLLFADRVFGLVSKRLDSRAYLAAADLAASAVVGALILAHLLSSHQVYAEQLVAGNRQLKKLVGLLFTAKAVRALRLALFQKEIRLVCDVAYKSFGFIADILLILAMVFFVFATLGIALFGGNVTSASFAQYAAKYGSELSEPAAHLNFNDYYHAFYSLFVVMISDWLGLIRVVTLETRPSLLYNAFFVLFFFISNMCFLNIIFGFVVGSMDSYMEAALKLKHGGESAHFAGGDNGDGDDGDDDGKHDDRDARSDATGQSGGREDLSADLDHYISVKKKAQPELPPGRSQSRVRDNRQEMDIDDNMQLDEDADGEADAHLDEEGDAVRSELLQEDDGPARLPAEAPKKRVTFKARGLNASGYDPLDEIIKSIRFKNANE